MNLIQKVLSTLLTSKHKKQLDITFNHLFEKAQELNLPKRDLSLAKEYLEHSEYELCLDHMATQFYEFGLSIDVDFYYTINRLSKMMSLPNNTYQYLESLILKP